MPKEVITRVDTLGRAEGQPKLLTFYNRKGEIIGDNPEYYQIPGVDREPTGVELDQEPEQLD